MVTTATQAPSRRFPSMIEMAETASIRSVAPSYSKFTKTDSLFRSINTCTDS